MESKVIVQELPVLLLTVISTFKIVWILSIFWVIYDYIYTALIPDIYSHRWFESIQENPLAPANMMLLAYNIQRSGGCSGHMGSIPGPAYPTCPLGSGFSYELALNVCYKMVSSVSPTENASCIQEGGCDLLMIDTQEKLDFFKHLVPTSSYAHIRGDRIPSTGEWVYWEEGIACPSPIIEWAPGQPDNATEQKCMVMGATGQRDLHCIKHILLCEYNMQ